jgi:hypothetical protein
MNIYLVLYLLWVGGGIWASLQMRSLGPNWLMFWSVVFVAYGSVPSIGMLLDSKALNNLHFEFVGQALLLFFSVVGGALFSSAWNEQRQRVRSRLSTK